MDRCYTPRPMLAQARVAADELLIRKVAEGSMTADVAGDMMSAGFLVTTRILADLRRRDGLSEQAITQSFRRKLDEALDAGDDKRVNAAEFALAVWGGMQRDLAAYLRAAC